MSGNKLNRFNRVRYTLYGNSCGAITIFEPVGWEEDEKEAIRSKKYFGITANLSNNELQFYRSGFYAIKSEYDINGIKAVVRIEKEVRNDNSDNWEIDYIGWLDFTTYTQNKNYISIKINENKFFKNIDSRFKDQFELDRLDDLKGGALPPLQYKKLLLQGRDIFRESLFDNDTQLVKLQYKGSDIYTALQDIILPLNLKYRSDENIFAPTTLLDSNGFINLYTSSITRLGGDNARYNSGLVYYLTSPNNKLVKVKINLQFRVKAFSPVGNAAFFKIFHDYVMDDGGNLDTYFSYPLQYDNFASNNTWHYYNVNYESEFTLVEAASLGIRIVPYFGGSYIQANQMDFEFNKIVVDFSYNDNSEITECQALSYYQVFQRLIHIITGKDTFQSELLQNEWKDLLFTNGFKIRGFSDKNITTSLEEIYDSLNAIDDIAIIIKGNLFKIEKKGETFINEVGVDLGNVNNIKRKIEEEHHYSIIEIGNDFNGLYEEVNGLDEFNIKNQYTTCLDELSNKLSLISKVRFDGYGITLAQKKPFIDFPKTDTKYDKFNFAIDAKLVSGNTYLVRHWEDDFSTEPTGIYSVSTAFNLRLSPFNSLLRKGKTISTGLQKYPNEKLKYSSTEGNSNLVTLYPERAVIENNVLSIPYFLPETIEFDKKISLSLFRTILNNPYKLIKFVNEFGNIEYGFIFPSVKPNKEGKFILIKANY